MLITVKDWINKMKKRYSLCDETITDIEFRYKDRLYEVSTQEEREQIESEFIGI